MPKGAPGQPRAKGGGRKRKEGYSRHNIYIPTTTWTWYNRQGNASAEIEKLGREKMEQQARARIDEMGFTAQQLDFIWADWPNMDEHIQWLTTASREEIESWGEAANWGVDASD